MRLIDKDSIDGYLEQEAAKAHAEQEVERVAAAAKAVANEKAAGMSVKTIPDERRVPRGFIRIREALAHYPWKKNPRAVACGAPGVARG